jgi:hypothetical protein
MAPLSTAPPTLKFDTAELKKWGYIWRVGTKIRKKKQDEDEEIDEEPEGGEIVEVTDEAIAEGLEVLDGADVAANAQGAAAAVVAAAGDPIEVGVNASAVLTADAAGVPPDVLALFKPNRKYPSAFNKKSGNGLRAYVRQIGR